MIQKLDVHEVACFLHSRSEPDVALARLRIARRMVVQEYYPRGVVEQGPSDDRPVVNGCLCEGAHRYHLLRDDGVVPRKEDDNMNATARAFSRSTHSSSW